MSRRSNELREERGRIHAASLVILNKTNPTKEELEQVRAMHADMATKKTEIDLIEESERLERELSETRRPPEDQIGGDRNADASRGTYWLDQHDRKIRVLKNTESLYRSLMPAGGYREESGLGFGRFCRAVVMGATTDAEKRTLEEATDGAGGYLVPLALSSTVIDRLRARSVCFQAGAITVPMTSQTLKIARIAQDMSVSWRPEAGVINDSDATFDAVQFIAKSLAGIVKVSRELLEDASNLDQIITDVFAKAIALEVDRVCLLGTGSNDQPTGIATTSGVGSISMGTNGAALANFDKLSDAVTTLRTANAAEPTAAILAPRTAGTIDKFKDTLNQPMRKPGSLEKMPFLITSSLGVAETQGTSSVASRIILGDFTQLMVGMRTSFGLTHLKERYSDYGLHAFLAWMRCDVALAHPQSFCQLVGITP